MWRRRLYHRCEELFKEKISERGRRRRGRKRRRKWIRGWSKTGSRNPADFRAFSLSLSPSFPFPPLSLSPNYLPNQGSLYIPWEIGLNGVDQNRFSKINAFRRRTVSNDRDNATKQSVMIRDIQMRIQSIKNRSLGRAKDGKIHFSIRDFLVTFRIILQRCVQTNE